MGTRQGDVSTWPSPGDRSRTPRDYLRVVEPEDTDELDIPEESEIEFNYGPETQWTEEEYL